MAGAVFALCAVTSGACLALLVRAYRRNGGRLVFWSAVCFAGLTLNNLLLAANRLFFPSAHLSWRALPAAIGLVALAYGLTAEELRSRRSVPRRMRPRRRARVTT